MNLKFERISWLVVLAVAMQCSALRGVLAQNSEALVGVWELDEGFQVTELLFRSDGRYQIETKSTNPDLDFSSSDRGEYVVNGSALVLKPFDWLGDPGAVSYDIQLQGAELTLVRRDLEITQVYHFKPGSREAVLGQQSVPHVLIGQWRREITFAGTAEFTFRPGGYYVLVRRSQDDQFPPEYIRGRYEQHGSVLTVTPYSGTDAHYELDFFGNTLTLINREESSGSATTYEKVPGSEAVVLAKAAEAAAFLGRETWPVGVWEIRAPFHTVDLTLRPDGYYTANEQSELLRGVVRGRYTIEDRRIHFQPFVGQAIYARSNGEFGNIEHSRELDYYDGELQFINLEALSQSVTLAQKREGSEAAVISKVQAAAAERLKPDWWVGIWEVNDPTGWMEFTFRPNGRYIAKSGSNRRASEVERGEYLVRGTKLTLTPYPGMGAARAFEFDLYDGDLSLAGDLSRLVIASKQAGSDLTVIQRTFDPLSRKGERGIFGLWTAHLPGSSAELVLRPDGEFRLTRCANEIVSRDYGLYRVDMTAETMIYDSRFSPAQSLRLDFYGDTLTLYGGAAGPSTYTINLGQADAAIQQSLAEDASEAQGDAQWISRLPIGPRDPNAVQKPSGDIPTDPFPTRIFDSPTVFAGYELYRRLIPGFVYFKVQDVIRSVAIVNTREWHFFPTGRLMVRFKNYSASPIFPNTIESVSTSWGAYRIEGKPTERDILHIYADNRLVIEMDSGERMEMTLEDGRRNLFWEKDYQIQIDWATEQKNVPCQPVEPGDPSLANTGVSLRTSIPPDVSSNTAPVVRVGRSTSGLVLNGSTQQAANLVLEAVHNLTGPIAWQPVSTNNVAAGEFSLTVPLQGANAGYYRIRVE